jgi:stage II sporulation protein D
MSDGQNVRIGILSEKIIKTLVFAPSEGIYQIVADSIQMEAFDKTLAVCIQVSNDSLMLKMSDGRAFTFSEITFMSGKSSYFRICIDGLNIKTYDDNLIVRNRFGSLLLINEVEMDDYLCGVIEKETGKKKNKEFYKTQAILCRTYWAKARENHLVEGYQLCDGVHCQAFMGKPSDIPNIRKAVEETYDLIITDTTGAPVTAVFHGNCGGITEGAENVWVKSRPYLKPVHDEFCLSMPGAEWTKSLSLKEWREYLKNAGINNAIDCDPIVFNFLNNDRKTYYKVGGDSLTFVKMRNELKLRSAFFLVRYENNQITLSGRGYGHGVGMCQEGAMNMAKQGYTYRQIIAKYFTGVEIRTLTESDSLKNLYNETQFIH